MSTAVLFVRRATNYWPREVTTARSNFGTFEVTTGTRCKLWTIFGDSVTSVALAKETGGFDQPARFGKHGVEAAGKKPVVTETSVVVGCVDGKVRTYDLRKGRMHADNFKVPVTSVKVSRDGHVAAASCLDRSC